MLPAQHETEEEAGEPPLLIHPGEVKGGDPVPLLPEETSKEVSAPLTLTHQTQTQEAAPIQIHQRAILERRQITNSPGTRRFANFSAP